MNQMNNYLKFHNELTKSYKNKGIEARINTKKKKTKKKGKQKK